MDFVKEECSGKSKKGFHVESAILGFVKKCTQLSEKDFKLISFNKVKSLCQSCFGEFISFSHVNESPKNNKSLKTYSHIL